jgi:hypothetical protein
LEPLPTTDAVELLSDRLRAVGAYPPDATGTDPLLQRLCRILDGLPLALELAARPLALLGSEQLLARMDQRLRLLRGTSVDPRHSSLDTAFASSYDLAGADERQLFCQLAVFAGTFDLEAADRLAFPSSYREGVARMQGADRKSSDTTGPVHDDVDTLDLLERLVELSLVTVRGGGRFGVLESLKAFGRSRLPRGERRVLADRHAAVMADRMDSAAMGLRGPDEATWVRRIEADFDDLRVAVEHAVATNQPGIALRIASPLAFFMMDHMRLEPADWAEAALALPGARHHRLAAPAHVVVGYGCQHRGLYERAAHHGLESERLDHDAARSPSWEASVQAGAAYAYLGEAREALRRGRQAVGRARVVGDDYGVSRGLWTIVYSAAYRGQFDCDAAEEALRLAERTGNPTLQARAHILMGMVRSLDQVGAARRHFATAERFAAASNARYFIGIARAYAAHARALEDAAAGLRDFVALLGWYWSNGLALGASRQLVREIIPALVDLGLDELAASLDGSEPPLSYRPRLVSAALARARSRLGPSRFEEVRNRASGVRENEVIRSLFRSLPPAFVDEAPLAPGLHDLRSDWAERM